MIAIIDYGAGNIFSVKNALDYLGLAGELTSDPEAIRKADALILPGVGAFPSAMQMLHDSGLTNIIQEEAHKKPFLGICLGMQLIFEKGYEFDAVVLNDKSFGDNSDFTLKERLERIIYLSDDRNIVAKYFAGNKII